MPWKDLSLVQQGKAFIDEYLKRQDSVSQLCRRFAVSRKTACKWIHRFLAGCELTARSRRPRSSLSATAKALEEAIVAARNDRPRWGPKKLRAVLLRSHPASNCPPSVPAQPSSSVTASSFHVAEDDAPRPRPTR